MSKTTPFASDAQPLREEAGTASVQPDGSDPPADLRTSPARRGRGIVLTGQRLFCTVLLLACALPLAYLGGMVTGRHVAMRENMPAWQQEQQAAGAEARSGEKNSAGSPDESPSDGSQPGTQAIIPPQELTFARVLRAAPGEKEPETGLRGVHPFRPAVPADGQAGQAQPRNGQTAQSDEAPQAGQAPEPAMAPGMSPARVTGPPEPPQQAAELYDFVFQIAAFRAQSQADLMRLRVEAEGYRSRLEKSGRLHVVLLLTRGSLSRPAEVREVLQRMGLGTPIERSRRPVLRPAPGLSLQPRPAGQRQASKSGAGAPQSR